MLDLAACSARPGQVLSLSQDASARLWDVVEETCLAVWTLDALSLVSFATADLLMLGGLMCLVPGGYVHCWGLCRETDHGNTSTEIDGLQGGGLKKANTTHKDGLLRQENGAACCKFSVIAVTA